MWLYVVASLAGLFGLLYFYMTQEYGFFKSKGIKEDPPYFPFGSSVNWKTVMGKCHMIEICSDLARKFPNEKVVGYYSMGTPVAVITDLDLAKHVLVKNFDHFQHRRVFAVSKKGKLNEAIQRTLLVLTGEEWKIVRAKMSPVFTSGKLKGMTGLINEVGDNLVSHLDRLALSGKEFESKTTLGLFSLDVIASCGFGIESNSFASAEGPLIQMAEDMMSPGPFKVLEILTIFMAPKLAELLQLSLFNKKAMAYLYEVILSTMKSRKTNEHRRNDFVDHVLDALKDKKLEREEELSTQFERDANVTTDKKLNLTEPELERDMVANALIFFFAGLDTASTVLSIIMVTLTQQPDAQERVYQEIRDAVEDSQAQGRDTLSYQTVQGLPLLDALIHETMRCYPLGFVERICSKDYHVPNTNLVIPSGMLVQVPGAYFHHHTDHFPGGAEFDLDNWTPESKASRSPYAFMGFGQGPRNCIGMRFAVLEMKYALIRIMYNFRVRPGPRTPKEMTINPRSFGALPVGGTWVRVEKRDHF